MRSEPVDKSHVRQSRKLTCVAVHYNLIGVDSMGSGNIQS
jgi:hypothetical protein